MLYNRSNRQGGHEADLSSRDDSRVFVRLALDITRAMGLRAIDVRHRG